MTAARLLQLIGWTGNIFTLLYSCRFFRYSAPIHWLVHGHMTSKNETVSRQMPWAGNIAKTMTSNGKQFTITREMLTAVARDQRWPVAGISARFSKFVFCFVLLYNKSLNDWSLGEQEFCFPRISMFPSTSSWKMLRFLGNKIHCSPRDQSLSVKWLVRKDYTSLRGFHYAYCWGAGKVTKANWWRQRRVATSFLVEYRMIQMCTETRLKWGFSYWVWFYIMTGSSLLVNKWGSKIFAPIGEEHGRQSNTFSVTRLP